MHACNCNNEHAMRLLLRPLPLHVGLEGANQLAKHAQDGLASLL